MIDYSFGDDLCYECCIGLSCCVQEKQGEIIICFQQPTIGIMFLTLIYYKLLIWCLERSGIDGELSRVLKGFGVHLTATVEEECIHGVTEETNRRSMMAPFRGEQVATPWAFMMTPNVGNSKRSYRRQVDRWKRNQIGIGIKWLKPWRETVEWIRVDLEESKWPRETVNSEPWEEE